MAIIATLSRPSACAYARMLSRSISLPALTPPLDIRDPQRAAGRQARLRRQQMVFQFGAAARKQQQPVGRRIAIGHAFGRQRGQQRRMFARGVQHGQRAGIFHIHFFRDRLVRHAASRG